METELSNKSFDQSIDDEFDRIRNQTDDATLAFVHDQTEDNSDSESSDSESSVEVVEDATIDGNNRKRKVSDQGNESPSKKKARKPTNPIRNQGKRILNLKVGTEDPKANVKQNTRKNTKKNKETIKDQIEKCSPDSFGLKMENKASETVMNNAVKMVMDNLADSVRKLETAPEPPQTQDMTVDLLIRKFFKQEVKIDPRNRHSQRDITCDYVMNFIRSTVLIPKEKCSFERQIRSLIFNTQEPMIMRVKDGVEYISNGLHRFMSFLCVLLGYSPIETKDGERCFYLIPKEDFLTKNHRGYKLSSDIKYFYEQVDKVLKDNKFDKTLINRLRDGIGSPNKNVVDPHFKDKKLNEKRLSTLNIILDSKMNVNKYKFEDTIISMLKRLHRTSCTPETILNFLVQSPSVPANLARDINNLIDKSISLDPNHVMNKIKTRRVQEYHLQQACDTKCMVWATLISLCLLHTNKQNGLTTDMRSPLGFFADNVNVSSLNTMCGALSRIKDSNPPIKSKWIKIDESDPDEYIRKCFKYLWDKLFQTIKRIDEEIVEGILSSKRVAGYTAQRLLKSVIGNVQKTVYFMVYIILNSVFRIHETHIFRGHVNPDSDGNDVEITVGRDNNGGSTANWPKKKKRLYPICKKFIRECESEKHTMFDAMNHVLESSYKAKFVAANTSLELRDML